MKPDIKRLKAEVSKLTKRDFDKFAAWLYREDSTREYRRLADETKGIAPGDLVKELRKRASFLFEKPKCKELNFWSLAGDSMGKFYREVRVKGCRFQDDADMLLAEWGAISDAEFRLAYIRQVIPPRPDGERKVWQLTVDTRYPVSEKLKRLKPGTRWFKSVRQFENFEAFRHTSPVCQALAGLKPIAATVSYEDVD